MNTNKQMKTNEPDFRPEDGDGQPRMTRMARMKRNFSTEPINSMLVMKTRIQKLLVGAALMGAATLVQAQFNYTDNGNGTCTITGYTGAGGAVNLASPSAWNSNSPTG